MLAAPPKWQEEPEDTRKRPSRLESLPRPGIRGRIRIRGKLPGRRGEMSQSPRRAAKAANVRQRGRSVEVAPSMESEQRFASARKESGPSTYAPRMDAHFHWEWPPDNARPSALPATKGRNSIAAGIESPPNRAINRRVGSSPETGRNPL